MNKSLKKVLKQNKIKFSLVEHRKVYTAYDSAETQDLKQSEVAKAVLLKGNLPAGKAGKNLYLAVLPAGNNCDFKALGKLAQDKVAMAKEKDIYRELSAKGGSASGGKTKIGLLAPFGSLYNLPVFLDKKLLKNKKINLPAGSYTESVIMSVKDYLMLENPVTGNFSIKK